MGWLDGILSRGDNPKAPSVNPNISRTPNGQGFYDRKTGKQIPKEDVIPVTDKNGHIVGYRLRGPNEPKRNERGNVRQGADSSPESTSKTQAHGAGAKGPSLWNPTADAQRQGHFAPHQGT